ncbi:hypothetical protein [Leptolyngbya sp. BC1307]|uniref:hypothetical protein n=1 Tax=Leptolyngbya sp. BC1307 TaxID=2029589 RepID=UPI001140F782|nr:hypothetical protein [Leptolyngbya sp. BC1307]
MPDNLPQQIEPFERDHSAAAGKKVRIRFGMDELLVTGFRQTTRRLPLLKADFQGFSQAGVPFATRTVNYQAEGNCLR